MELWDKKTGFSLADGTPCTVEEIFERYPFTRKGTIVLTRLANGNVGAIDDLAVLKQVYQVGDEFEQPEDILTEIQRIKALPPEPRADATEAKLDYLVMMMS